MGVRRTDYIVIGADIGQDAVADYEEFYESGVNDDFIDNEKVGEISYIIDGMSGRYFIVGEVLRAADEYDGLGFNSFDLDGGNGFISSRLRVKKHVKDNFGMDVDTQLLIFTHWS